MQSQTYKPRDPKTPLDIDIDNIAYNETYEEDLEYYGLEEIIDPLNELDGDKWEVIWADEDLLDDDDDYDEFPEDLFADDNISDFVD
jgi:hypothetical protein